MKTKLIKKLKKKIFKRTNWILKLKKTKIYNKLIKIISNKYNKNKKVKTMKNKMKFLY
jgi:hypothetical protein